MRHRAKVKTGRGIIIWFLIWALATTAIVVVLASFGDSERFDPCHMNTPSDRNDCG